MITNDLWLGVMHGSYRRGSPSSPEADEIRGTWAVTYFVTADAPGYTDEIGDNLITYVASRWSPFPGLEWISEMVWRDSIVATHVDSDQRRTNDFQIRIGSSASVPMPMQAALLVLGRTNGIRHFVRRWLPGFSLDAHDEQGRPPIGDDHPGVTEWARSHMLPGTFGGNTFTPVCWDADKQEVRQITEIAASREWRTQRRRSLQADDDIITI